MAAPAETAHANGIATLRKPSGLRLVDDVAHSIEDAILAARMRPGERLIETKLCDELGVSRTTLREALLILERRGLVRGEPRRGTFVTRLAREDAVDLCRARALLEAFALTTCYDRLDAVTFAALDDLLDEMAVLNLPEDVPRLIGIDLAFHRLLIRGAEAPRIVELWSSLDGQMSALILSSIDYHHAGIDDVVAFHRALLDAVRSGDVAVAREAVLIHYVGNGDGRHVSGDRRQANDVSLSEAAEIISSLVKHASHPE
jgi:GntR family transcriptional regulator, rspAB operon transcriptional repressor